MTTLRDEYCGLLAASGLTFAPSPCSVPTDRDVLIVVDMQIDFLPGGSFALAEGDAVVAPIVDLIRRFAAAGSRIFATRDYHPVNHCSFATHSGPFRSAWTGSFILFSSTRTADINAPPDVMSVLDRAPLAQVLTGEGAVRPERVFVVGLALDYCVLDTAVNAAQHGLHVVVVPSASRAAHIACRCGKVWHRVPQRSGFCGRQADQIRRYVQ
jgi:nicotinamidase/pyrazinamidase